MSSLCFHPPPRSLGRRSFRGASVTASLQKKASCDILQLHRSELHFAAIMACPRSMKKESHNLSRELDTSLVGDLYLECTAAQDRVCGVCLDLAGVCSGANRDFY